MSRAVRRTVGASLAALLAVALWVGPDWLHGTAFVVRAAGMRGDAAEALSQWRTVPFDVSDLRVPTRHGPVRARLYRPLETRRGRTVVLTSGVHADGIDEPRLVKLAGDLAAGGHTVLTPEPGDLLRYEITPRLPDIIEDAAAWAAGQPELAPDGKVSLFGISFSGGLSVVAAGRPALKDRVAATLSFGGHGDLPRVLAFLCTGELPDGRRLTPHDYGVVVILLNVADRLVPPEQVEPLRAGIRTFLRASHLTLTDGAKADFRPGARVPGTAARAGGHAAGARQYARRGGAGARAAAACEGLRRGPGAVSGPLTRAGLARLPPARRGRHGDSRPGVRAAGPGPAAAHRGGAAGHAPHLPRGGGPAGGPRRRVAAGGLLGGAARRVGAPGALGPATILFQQYGTGGRASHR